MSVETKEVVQESEMVNRLFDFTEEDVDTTETDQADDTETTEEFEDNTEVTPTTEKEVTSNIDNNSGVTEEEFDKQVLVEFNSLVDEGYIKINPDKEYANLREVIEENFDSVLERKLESIQDSANKDIVSYILKGGDYREWVDQVGEDDFTSYTEEQVINTSIETKLSLVKDLLEMSGKKPELINRKLRSLQEDEELLTEEALDAFNYFKNQQLQKKEELNKRIESQIQQKVEIDRQFLNQLRSVVIDSPNIKGIEMAKGEKEKLYDYLTKKDKEGKTQYERETTPESIALLGYINMNKLDLAKIQEKGAKKQNATLFQKLTNRTDGLDKGSSSNQEKKQGSIRDWK
jgi:hypothetical protein